jgi:rare lipoprotein A
MREMFVGVASIYADKFHGRRTASGERFDQHKFTCAHKFLPFGTRLLVKNTHNGRVCVVTVTDRGPFCKDRVLDLSKAAANTLGITGISKVICYDAKSALRHSIQHVPQPWAAKNKANQAADLDS